MKTGIICSMAREYELISRDCPEDVVVVLAGVGKVNAAVAAERMISSGEVGSVINLGVAGSMSPDFVEGDIVAASRVSYHDVWCGEGNLPGQVQDFPPSFEADPVLLAAALQLPGVRTAPICTGDQFFISAEEDARIRNVCPGAVAADMESAAVAQVCHIHGVPFLSVRIISDTHSDGRQKQHYEDFWENIADSAFRSLRKLLENLRTSAIAD